MSYLDAHSLFRLSRTCKRFYHLSQEDHLWISVDMSTLPYMDLRRTKKFVQQKLSPNCHSIVVESNFGRKPKRPKVDMSVLNLLLEHCPNLRRIELRFCDLHFLGSDESNFVRFESLTDIAMASCNTQVWWTKASVWPNLKHLSLARTVKTSFPEFQSLPWLCQLQSLDLSHCYRINDDGVRQICTPKNFPRLQSLHLSGTSITRESLPVLSVLPSLMYLYLSEIKGINDKDIKFVPVLFPCLQVLDLTHCPNVSQESCRAIKYEMRNTDIRF